MKRKTRKNSTKKMGLSASDYRKILKFYKLSIPKKVSNLRKKGDKIIANKFCSCIKKVRKKFKKEGIAIGICTKSVITRKGIKRGSKRSTKRKTRKKRGGMPITVEGMWDDISLNDIKKGEQYRVTNTSHHFGVPSPFIGTYKGVSQNSSKQNIFTFSIPCEPFLGCERETGSRDLDFPEGTIQRVEQYNIAPDGNGDLAREIKSYIG